MQTKHHVSEIQVSYTPHFLGEYELKSSKESFELMLEQWDKNLISMQEEVKVILLNRGQRVLGVYSLAKGGIGSCVVDVQIILSIALKTLATGLILVHNHPSGKLVPSLQDKQLTAKLKEACDIMSITLLDHIIISTSGYYSFADEGHV